MRKSHRYFVLVILALAQGVMAQVDDSFSDRFELRALRQDATVQAPMFKTTEPELQWTGQIGMSFTDSQNGNQTFSTPFSLKAGFDKSTARISSDVQYFDEKDGSSKSGLADVFLGATHRFWDKLDPRFPPDLKKEHKAVAEAGVFLPTGGDVGSSHSRQRIGLGYGGPLTERISVGTKANLVRTSADSPPGVSRFTRGGAVDVGYAIAPKIFEVSGSLSRSHRSGAGGKTKATFASTYTLETKQQVSFEYVRGLTEGAKDNGFTVNLAWPF